QALNADQPQFPVPDADTADQAASEGNYAALDPAVVAGELEGNAGRMATRLSTADGDGWTRGVHVGDAERSGTHHANQTPHRGRRRCRQSAGAAAALPRRLVRGIVSQPSGSRCSSLRAP